MRYSPYYKKNKSLSLKEAANIAGCHFEDESPITDPHMQGIADLDSATQTDISFLANTSYLKHLENTQAGACILHPDHLPRKPGHTIALLSDNPYVSYARLQGYFYTADIEEAHISESASIAVSAKLGKNATVLNHVVIDDNASIGEGSQISNGSYIGRGVVIGKNCYIGHNVVIEHAIIGDDCIIHSGAHIGQDGFGFATDRSCGKHLKVLQLGRVIIGNDVEIGSGCCIDRGSGPDTIIGDGCKLDNMVQVAHNVKLGKGCLIAGQSGIAGSAILGDYVAMGGQTAINGHIHIGNGVQIAGKSCVIKDAPDYQKVGGCPAVPIKQWHRQSIFLKRNSTM